MIKELELAEPPPPYAWIFKDAKENMVRSFTKILTFKDIDMYSSINWIFKP